MVGARCAVASCSNSYSLAKKRGHVLSLHSFPKDPDLKELWIEACSRGDEWNPDTSFVCSDHFALDDFISDQRLQLWTGVKWRPQLKLGAIPTRNLARTRCSKNDTGLHNQKEPHQRFSMFEVVSIELESRLKKAHRDIHYPHDDAEPNVGNAVEAGKTHRESSTGQAMDSSDSNQVDTSRAIASDGNNEKAAERITLEGSSTDSDAKNDESSLSEFPSHPPKKPRINLNQYRYAKTGSIPINQDPTVLPMKQVNNDGDYDYRKSQLSPVNSKIIYSCTTYELFVDDEDS